MKGYEKKLKEVKKEVARAIDYLKQDHAGADPDQAKSLLGETADAVRKDDLDLALSLAREAQVAAKPSLDFVVSHAREDDRRGGEAYRQGKAAEAVKYWEAAIQGYRKAREIDRAGSVEDLDSAIAQAERNLQAANRDQAKTHMQGLINEANAMAKEADARFETGDFDGAAAKYADAREAYRKGAAVARQYDFAEIHDLTAAEASMDRCAENCLLGKGESLIERAEAGEGADREQGLSEAIRHLNSFSSTGDRYRELQERAHRDLLIHRLQEGTGLMEMAESSLEQGQYPQAKDAYTRAQQYFEGLRDFAVEHRLEREKGKIDQLIEGCGANIRTCTDAMLSGQGMATGIRRVRDLSAGVSMEQPARRASEDKMARLKKAYASVEYVASGGFGEVWLARTEGGQTIALKVLREPDKHEDTFFREFQVWQKLNHRNIVRLLRPRINPLPLFEMEYVDGGDLRVLLDDDVPLSAERAGRIAFDIARGLEYAHSLGVIHADLKPRNILLTRTEEVKISDWGLGRIATSSSMAMGHTPGYAAPEQVLGLPLDRRTDVFQLGAVFYEMLTGDNPFAHGSLTERDEKTANLTPEKPSAKVPKVQPLDDLVMSCLEKDPANRPGMHEFREILSRYMSYNYGILLHVTGRTSEKVGLLCRNAMFAAKVRDFGECRRALSDLSANTTDHQIKSTIQSISQAMAYREAEGLEITDDVLNEIDLLMRRIERSL